jgi:hypothetical protein
MNFVLNTSCIAAASLALVPLAASADEGNSMAQYISIVDAQNVDSDLAVKLGLGDYEGPIVVAQTAPSEEMSKGYIIQMAFSQDAMGPLEDNPIFELVDTEDLDGAPMFLSDRLSPKMFGESLPGDHMAGMLDLNYAADAIFDELAAGIGEGDYLAVTYGSVESADLPGQQVFGADVVDPSNAISSDKIGWASGVHMDDSLSVGIAFSVEEREIAAGFESEVHIDWINRGPESAQHTEQEEQHDGAGASEEDEDGTDVNEDGTEEQGIEGRAWEVPTEAGGQMDLPEFTPSPRSPVRDGASFAPALHTAVRSR